MTDDELVRRASVATPDRPFQLEAALRRGVSVGTAPRGKRRRSVVPGPDNRVVGRAGAARVGGDRRRPCTDADWRRAKRLGFSDAQLAYLWAAERGRRPGRPPGCGVRATFKTVDTCAAEFDARTPYHYSTYEDDDEVAPAQKPKVVILGSGPNRIGQGVEFDYCCVQASFALHDAGFETVMVNCNPETVSTDYDTSDRLYFEPVTVEDVRNIIDVESADGHLAGVIVALGGQTPLKLSDAIAGRPRARHLARRRSTWPRTGSGGTPCATGWRSPSRPAGRPRHLEEALGDRGQGRVPGPGAAQLRAGRPGHGDRLRRRGRRAGRWSAMADFRVTRARREACRPSGRCWSTGSSRTPSRSTSTPSATPPARCVIGAVMEHVEEAGVHSGDSACVVPPPTLEPADRSGSSRLTPGPSPMPSSVTGPLNVQFAVKRAAPTSGLRCS